MKRLVTILVILVVLLLLCFLGIFHIKHVRGEVENQIQKIEQSIDEGDFEKSSELCEQLQARWNQYSERFDMYIKHESVDKIAESIVKLTDILHSEEVNLSRIEIGNIRYFMNHLYESELPTFGNIL